MHKLPFRQVHLDFHTSPAIPDIGADFDKKHWQATLKRAHVNSITLFGKCHHGWSYYNTKVARKHPHMKPDLLRRQFDACKEIGVNAPIYISAGVDNVAAYEHPEWRELDHEGKYSGWSTAVISPGFQKLCFHSPYMDYLCEQIEEVVDLFPQNDGIFLDIIFQRASCSRWGMDYMHENGLDPLNEEDRAKANERALSRYYKETTAACKKVRDDNAVFHNSGHITRGKRDILKYFSHLELESLPTGGWGYDHFPLSAKYAKQLELDFLGMTGKFHTSWGEFGGYKHPNALRYECAAMLAFGSKCSVGDQLAPRGGLDESTYDIIGAAYSEVEAKEPWCDGAENVADVAMLSVEAAEVEAGNQHPSRNHDADNGAARVLLESHCLFDVIDAQMPFDKYKAVLLPDEIAISDTLKKKLDTFVRKGGKLILSGKSGIAKDGQTLLFDIGADHEGTSEYEPDFLLPADALQPDFVHQPMVMYAPSQRIKATTGASLGQVYDPYFNRNYKHFCSHQHTPAQPDASGYDAGVMTKKVLYFAHPVFSIYANYGQVALRQFISKAIAQFLGDDATLAVQGMPSTGRVSLMQQKTAKRQVLHLLYANTIARGGGSKRARAIEVIDELLPLRDVTTRVKVAGKVKKVTSEPDGTAVAFKQKGDRVTITVDEFTCHKMLVLQM